MKNSRLLNQIVGGSYEADERIAGCAVSQNLYAESVEEASNGSYYTTALRSVDGERVVLSDFVDGDGAKGCRGMFTASDESIFAAFGEAVYRISKNIVSGEYSATEIYREQLPTTGPVRFCETGGINSHICWVDGTDSVKAYPISPEKAEALGMKPPFSFNTPLRQYKTADQIKNESEQHVMPDQICSLNGSLIINDPESDTWYYTDAYILGGTTYKREVYDLKNGNVQYQGDSYTIKTKTVDLTENDTTSVTSYLWLDRYSKPNFMTAEYSADKMTGICVSGDFLFVFGSRSIQIYNQTTSTDAQGFSSMVFSSTGRNIRDLGCVNPSTITELNQNVIFLGASSRGERSIWATSGGAPVRISTNAIERQIDGVFTEDCYSFGYISNGHQFYGISFPSIRKTFVYDFATRQWHNRATQNANGFMLNWWGRFVCYSSGDIVIASSDEDIIAVFDKKKFDDYKGNPIIKQRTAPILTSDYAPFIVNDMQLLWNTGTTNDVTNENGARNPVVMLEVSTDGGNTFGSERWAYGGQTGNYAQRTIWYGIGSGTLFVFRITISARVNVVITGAKFNYTTLSHF